MSNTAAAMKPAFDFYKDLPSVELWERLHRLEASEHGRLTYARQAIIRELRSRRHE